MFGFPRSPGKQDFRARPRLYNNTMPLKDCLLLLDAGRETYAHNETNIATLHDFSGNENHATVTGSTLTYTNDAVPAFHFDGSQYAGTPAIGVGEGTIFFVSKIPSSAYVSGYCVSMQSAQLGSLGGYTGRGFFITPRNDSSSGFGVNYAGTSYYQYGTRSATLTTNRVTLTVLRWKDVYTQTWYRHCGIYCISSFGEPTRCLFRCLQTHSGSLPSMTGQTMSPSSSRCSASMVVRWKKLRSLILRMRLFDALPSLALCKETPMSDPFVAGTSTSQTAPAELWRRAVAGITTDAQSILKKVEEAQKIYRGNKFAALIAATAPGAAVEGTTMSKEQAEAWAALVAAVVVFKDAEVQPGLTVQDGLYAAWPAVAPPPAPPAPVVAPPAPVVAPSVAPDAPPVLPDVAPMP